jgi:putative glutamine amidotransferase
VTQRRSRPTAVGLDTALVVPARTGGGGREWGVPRTYVEAIAAAGLTPLIVVDAGLGEELLAEAGGLLLPGGPDVEPARYGARPHPTTQFDAALDDLEFALVRAALAEDRPVLAICRGIQVLNVALGGTLVQDLPTERPSGVVHNVGGGSEVADPRHALEVDPASWLAHALGPGPTSPVTSRHHQAIDRLGEGLVATAWAPDGTVEAVELPGRAVVGVQFHPERMDRDAAERRAAAGLFRAFAAWLRGDDGSRVDDGDRPAVGIQDEDA